VFAIERRGRDWIIVRGDDTVSVHPTRHEAQRAFEWLTANHTNDDNSNTAAEIESNRETLD